MTSDSPKTWPRLLPAGDEAVVVEFGDAIDVSINERVYEFAETVQHAALNGVRELVPTYRSLLVQYDLEVVGYDDLVAELGRLASAGADHGTLPGRSAEVFELPVGYGGENGPDLETVAQHAGMSPDDVVSIHSSVAYRVFMLGFAPGFPYLGGMDARIACPRLKTPRTRVPAGSVGIAESQTGVYPNDSPGGWQIIGRTPVPLFDPGADPPVVIQPGSHVRFVSVSGGELAEIETQVAQGNYQVVVREREA
ncbi:MAG: 5-oxoprolinase subunit PxpB [Dehalococcoidia bacterium]